MEIIFDLETAPRQNAAIFIPPYEAFDERSVKYGNTKDPRLVMEKLQNEREKHHLEQTARQESFLQKAALSPLTGQIVAIGARAHDPLQEGTAEFFMHQSDSAAWAEGIGKIWSPEEALIRDFERWIGSLIPSPGAFGTYLVSWAGSSRGSFDANFLRRRTMAHSIQTDTLRYAKYINATQMYLRDAGTDIYLSLDNACLEMEIPKFYSGVTTGATFAQRFEEDPVDAMNYLRGDVYDLSAVWNRLCLVRD